MSEYNPKLTSDQLKEYEQYKELEDKLKPLCRWVDFKDYIWAYSYLDYRGKVVLDVGGDIGSSALYFLSKGAKYVAIVEHDKVFKETYNKLKEEMPELRNTEMIEPDDMWRVNASILKMDCEGCELYMLDENKIKDYDQFAVGLHKFAMDEYFFNKKQKALLENGGKFLGTVNNEEYMYIKSDKIL